MGVRFEPSVKMLRFVVALNNPENSKFSNSEILEKLSISDKEHAAWWNDFVIHEQDPQGNITNSLNHFEKWFDNALQIRSSEERALLRHVGMTKALEGNFNFFKEMGKTFGAITDEEVDRAPSVIPFTIRGDATPEEIADARQKLLSEVRALEHASGPRVVGALTKQQKSSDN